MIYRHHISSKSTPSTVIQRLERNTLGTNFDFQLNTLGRRNRKFLPLVYVLANKKDSSMYETVFAQLKLAEPKLNPKMIMVDFERAAMNAAELIFEDVEVNGCFFHFCQCLFRQIQANGLQKIYSEDSEFAVNIRCLAALAFVPEEDVVQQFEALKEFEFFKQKIEGKTEVDIAVQKLLMYMETTWIGRKLRRTVKPGTFALNLWNVYQLTLDLFPRTNNAVEAWHNVIAQFIGIAHPNIFNFINNIKLEQDATEVLITQIMSGVDVSPPPNKKNMRSGDRILNVVKTYGDIELEQYLLGISQSLKLAK